MDREISSDGVMTSAKVHEVTARPLDEWFDEGHIELLFRQQGKMG